MVGGWASEGGKVWELGLKKRYILNINIKELGRFHRVLLQFRYQFPITMGGKRHCLPLVRISRTPVVLDMCVPLQPQKGQDVNDRPAAPLAIISAATARAQTFNQR